MPVDPECLEPAGTSEAASFCRDEMPGMLLDTLDLFLELWTGSCPTTTVATIKSVEGSRLSHHARTLERVIQRYGTSAQYKRCRELTGALQKAV